VADLNAELEHKKDNPDIQEMENNIAGCVFEIVDGKRRIVTGYKSSNIDTYNISHIISQHWIIFIIIIL